MLRSAATTAAMSSVVVWGEFIDELADSDPSLYRRIVLERQLGGPLHPELPRESRLQERMRRLEGLERALSLALRPEHRDEDARVSQVGRRLDARQGDEPDARILQLRQRLGEDVTDGLVYTPHALRHARYSSGLHALVLAAGAARRFTTAVAGGLVGLVLGNIRLPVVLLAATAPAAGAGANISISGVAALAAASAHLARGGVDGRLLALLALRVATIVQGAVGPDS